MSDRSQPLQRFRGLFATLGSLVLLLPMAASAENRPLSLFTTEARTPAAAREDGLAQGIGDGSPVPAEGARIGASPEPGRNRMARVDRAGLGAVREAVRAGRSTELRLNLFHDVEFEAVIERSKPTPNGYTLSGPLRGVPFGSAARCWWSTAGTRWAGSIRRRAFARFTPPAALTPNGRMARRGVCRRAVH